MAINPGFPIGGGGDFQLIVDLVIKSDKKERLRLDHETGSIFIHDKNGKLAGILQMPAGNLRLGGGGPRQDGDILLLAIRYVYVNPKPSYC